METSIKDLLAREPFQPFRIVMTSGKQYDVRSPYMVALGKRQIFYCFPKTDRLAYLQAKEITALETLQNN